MSRGDPLQSLLPELEATAGSLDALRWNDPTHRVRRGGRLGNI